MVGVTRQESTNRIDGQSYEEIEKVRIDEIRRKKGTIRSRLDAYFGWFSPGIAYETREDWLRVQSYFDIIKARLLKDTPTPEIAHQLATANAYLELARETRDLAETWAFVLQAGEILCRLGNDDEKTVFLQQVETWQPILKRWLNELYEDREIVDNLEETLEGIEDKCQKLAILSQHWTLVDQWISFSRRLWRLALIILLVSLALAIGVAETLYVPTEAGSALTEHPFCWISVLGLFGGALSALSSASARKVTAVTYGQSRSRIFIRLVLGASGAFIAYTLISLPGLIDGKVAGIFQNKLQGFLALGIVAGFSERLFKDALERLAKQFPTTEPQTEKTMPPFNHNDR